MDHTKKMSTFLLWLAYYQRWTFLPLARYNRSVLKSSSHLHCWICGRHRMCGSRYECWCFWWVRETLCFSELSVRWVVCGILWWKRASCWLSSRHEILRPTSGSKGEHQWEHLMGDTALAISYIFHLTDHSLPHTFSGEGFPLLWRLNHLLCFH